MTEHRSKGKENARDVLDKLELYRVRSRWAEHITQDQLAKKLGVSQPKISRTLNSNSAPIDIVAGIASALGYKLVLQRRKGDEK